MHDYMCFFIFLKNAVFNPRPRDKDSKSALCILQMVQVLTVRVFVVIFLADWASQDDQPLRVENLHQPCFFSLIDSFKVVV